MVRYVRYEQDERDDRQELWLPVVGFEGYYEVSDLGRVRSLDRWIEQPNRWGGTTRYRKPGRILALRRKRNPLHAYATVILSVDGVTSTHAVHTLVLTAFRRPPQPGEWARHGPIGLSDNSVGNLQWGTPSDNAYDRVADGHDHHVNAEDCPWGHPLTAPNLDPGQLGRGFRRCYACALTQMWGRYHRQRTGSPVWRVEADRRHAEILHFGTPIDYKHTPGAVRWTPDRS